MPSIEVRPFRRTDREQLAELANAHVGAVVPGISVSVSAILSQLEREPGEYVVDPWAVDRATIVAVARDRVVAAAHLIRYGSDPSVFPDYRDAGEVRWLVCWPDDEAAGDEVLAAALAQLERWGVARVWADGGLPAPGVYGIPDAWPHVARIFERGGLAPGERVEIVLAADVADLPDGIGPPPIAGMTMRRVLGGHATRFVAELPDGLAGFVEVDTDLTAGGTLSRLAGWAELWEFHVEERVRGRAVDAWLLAHAADWLRFAGSRRLLAEVVLGMDDTERQLRFFTTHGFRELTRTRRGWRLQRRSETT